MVVRQTRLIDAVVVEIEERRVGAPRVTGLGGVTNPSKLKRVEYYRTQDRERTARRYQRRKRWFQEMKSQLACQCCGETFAAALDFHHLEPSTKRFNVGLGTVVMARSTFLAEIAKCCVLCSTCHRKHHHGGIDGLELAPIDVAILPPMPD